MDTLRFKVVPIANGTKFAVWERTGTYTGQDGDAMFGDFVSRNGKLFETSNESAALSYADRLNRGVYHYGRD